MSAITREALWARLRDASVVEGDAPPPGEARSPWFVRLMLGFAGWIGAMFLLMFVGVGLAFVIKSAVASLVVGAMACAAAALIYRVRPDGDFSAQFALAVSLAGQALLAFGWGQSLERSISALALGLAIQQAVLFALVPNFIHRVWCAWSASYAAVFALGNLGGAALAPAAVTAAFIAVWLREFDHPRRGELLRAAGYGLALAAVQSAVMQGPLTVMLFHWRSGHDAPVVKWAALVASSAVLVWAVLALLRREAVLLSAGQGKIALAGAIILAAISLKAPGVGPATAILIVGFANGNRVLAGLGIIALLGYLSHYYYSLETTLLYKSALLACAGGALLLARLALHRWWPLGSPEADRA